MVAGFKELEGITADLGIEAWGETLEGMFIQAGLGLASTMVPLLKSDNKTTRTILIEAPSSPDLLVKFLNEIIYMEEVDGFLLGSIPKLSIYDAALKTRANVRLETTLTGTIYNPSRHTINAHIKAATYHGLAIEETHGEFKVRVIFDI
jgi:SHS2 domain-containing protein